MSLYPIATTFGIGTVAIGGTVALQRVLAPHVRRALCRYPQTYAAVISATIVGSALKLTGLASFHWAFLVPGVVLSVAIVAKAWMNLGVDDKCWELRFEEQLNQFYDEKKSLNNFRFHGDQLDLHFFVVDNRVDVTLKHGSRELVKDDEDFLQSVIQSKLGEDFEVEFFVEPIPPTSVPA